MNELLDALVIGGGAAGLNGAIMLARSRRSVLVVDSGTPRNAPADGVHGLLGLDGIPPAELLSRGRDEVRGYGGQIVRGEVVKAEPGPGGFVVTLADGTELRARRLLVATGLRDVLPDVKGLAEQWGRGVVHCSYCHGWEVRDEPIGVLASVHHALLFRQLTDDLVFFANGTELDDDTRAKLTGRGIRIVETPVEEIESTEDSITGVRLADGEVVPRRVIAVMPTLLARTEGLEGLQLPLEDVPQGRRFVTGMAGTTPVKGVWVAGNATDLAAQVGASAAAGALAGAHMNADLLA
ncbi:NAD(P)/FAD-dependent oxidoreductase [Lentzea sp.]|uniref:NAD(P)/FAD-dependent oxidoreductase n=1 Tax=Lentzea sp. TaxID=56099 RepID=UPI002C52F6A0|nr:NAD(P)/FAD-dependent oxidoreductase [Lentzea sp.]HUQ59222.1 NAD(P)/FAD-dependent oxidoreductase [Lentzea sp.]